MFKRIKDWFASLAYAGLKPTTPGAPKEAVPAATAMGRLRDRIDRFLAGPASSDPLYLTNRTLWQKVRPMLVISVPVVILLAGLGYGLANIIGLNKPYQPPPESMSNAEIAKQSIPVLNKDLGVTTQHDLTIQDVVIPPGSLTLRGVARNETDHPINHAHVSFDLTDKAGSRQGAVSTDIEDIPAKKAQTFQFPIAQNLAAFAIVREVLLNSIDVEELVIQPGSGVVQGVAKNLTKHDVPHAHVIFDLLDSNGARVGEAATDVDALPAKATKPIQFTIPQKKAAFATVREIQTN